jgi:hypothetical protein
MLWLGLQIRKGVLAISVEPEFPYNPRHILEKAVLGDLVSCTNETEARGCG